MTTLASMNNILSSLRSRLEDADIDRLESIKDAPNSYGAGYDAGYASAIREIITDLTGEE